MALAHLLALVAPVAQAVAPTNFQEKSFQFQSLDMTLDGTLYVPETPGKHPAVVLVHGSNSANREKYRAEAEIFAKAGITALIYINVQTASPNPVQEIVLISCSPRMSTPL